MPVVILAVLVLIQSRLAVGVGPAPACSALTEAVSLDGGTLRSEAAAATTPASLAELRKRLETAIAGKLTGKGGTGAASAALVDGTALGLRQLTMLRRAEPVDAAWAPTLAWLLSTPEALDGLVLGGPIDGSWTQAMAVLHAVVTSVDGTRDGLGLRVALATALTWSEPVKAMADDAPIDPVARVRSFLAWDREGQLDPSFRTLSVWELRYVVGSWATDDDLAWARANIKADCRARGKIGDAVHGMVKYTLHNKEGVSVQEGRKFYGGRPMTLPVIVEVGGVCGAISRFGSSMCQAFGIPAMPVGQPGHCAFIWQKEPHAWSLNNDVSGWAESSRHSGIQLCWGDRAWMVPMMQAAQSDAAGYLAAQTLLDAAHVVGPKERSHLGLLTAATKRCPMHLQAWRERAACITTDRDAAEARKALKEASTALATQPLAYTMIALSLRPELVPDADTNARASRTWLLARADDLAAMAGAGADPTLCSNGLSQVLDVAVHPLSAKGRAAARAMARGDAPPKGPATITSSEVKACMDLCIDAAARLDGNAGSRRAAWRKSMQRVVAGAVNQPVDRERSLARIESVVTGLAGEGRVDDARWIADRLVEACKSLKDAGLEAKATALRGSLG
jgi:hypothetical protein